MEGKKYICSFADKRLNLTLKRFGEQAKQMNVYDGIFLYTEDDLESDFYRHFKDKFNLRGFGYWVWKPQVILQTLDKMQYEDILQYTDAGCHLNPNGLDRLNDYFEITGKSAKGVLSFYMKGVNKEKEYTKGDLFDYFEIRNKKKYHSRQIASTVLFVKKTKDSMELIKRWQQVYYDDFSLVDDTPSRSPNFDEFIENRHDQSVWSILLKLNDIYCISTVETWCSDWKLLRNYPILAKRDKVFGGIDKNNKDLEAEIHVNGISVYKRFFNSIRDRMKLILSKVETERILK